MTFILGRAGDMGICFFVFFVVVVVVVPLRTRFGVCGCVVPLFGVNSEETQPTEASIARVQSLYGMYAKQTHKHSRGVRQAGQHIYILSHIPWHLGATTATCLVPKCEG